MKENFSSIDRVYGKDVSAEEKKEILDIYKETFEDRVNNETFQEMLTHEREKTKEEIELVAFCNEQINALREKYGLKPFTVPESNFHIIPMGKWKDDIGYIESNMTAFFDYRLQGVAMREIDNLLVFAKIAYHEILHFHGYQAIMAERKSGKLKPYRFGMIIAKEKEGEERYYFENMNEGLTEELAKRFIESEYASENPHPLLRKRVQIMKGLRKEAKEKTQGSDLEKDIVDAELYYATPSGSIGEDFKLSNQYFFSYRKQRLILNMLIDALYERNKNNFNDREEVFDMFVKNAFTGAMYELGNLVDKTFGRGTLRKIGELDADIGEQEKFIKSLK